MKFKTNNKDFNFSDNKNQFINDMPSTYHTIANNTNIPNTKLLNEDILIPIETETYLNVNKLYFNLFLLYIHIVFK